ncbi:choline ABC transporter ATP-binding protein [Pseudogemmobacter humi]|uniref:Trimethylamine N-oxide transport system ATP-binding protein TmoW n=1 Tax=Pseudogemmobacter humi TaxID=2483812 RepID=A0A3P5WV54_9RHOB|nr:choline ABC transporter ATP-binding protein [Pseudogemmobacter humi]VDC19216.1 Glycine betaine/L-proline transport ATP-binding protein ProV [Pseudogemmobacter humi]
MTTAVEFRNVDIMFGARQDQALAMLDSGASRDQILQETGNVLGCAGASLSVQEGEISVLMGLSGSGKSTLLRAVNRLNIVSRGEVLVRDGDRQVDITSCDEVTLRRIRQHRVAMVFQQFGLLPWRTVEQNVGIPLELAGVPEEQRRRRVAEQLRLVNLDQWAGKYANELSGGMQQRVGLARAFVTEAPILLMDEPFSALDPLIRTKLQDELLILQEKLRKTILFVSHDLEEALKIGNHITIMESGRIVQTGTPEEIVLKPANAYVRDFVANVNPMSVLTAWNVMRDVRDLAAAGEGWVWLDRRRTTRLKLASGAAGLEVERDGKPVALVPYAAPQSGHDGGGPVFTIPVTMPLKAAMEAMQHSAAGPIAVLDGGRVVGAIGVRDVLGAILGREASGVRVSPSTPN